jgi:RHS repeat-associated protein
MAGMLRVHCLLRVLFWISAVFLLFFHPPAAHADCATYGCVTGFTLGGQVQGDSIDATSATVTVQCPTSNPNCSTVLAFRADNPGWGAHCHPPAYDNYGGCTMSAGSTLATISFSGWNPPPGTTPIVANITILVTPFDPGKTGTLTIEPLPSTGGSPGGESTPVAKKKGGGCMGPCSAGSPINLTNGNTWITETDYSIAGTGGGVQLARTWNSLWTLMTPPQTTGMFGNGWISTYEERLQTVSSGERYWGSDGDNLTFTYDSVNQVYVLTAPPDEHESLTFNSGTGLFTLKFTDGSSRTFNSSGYLTAILDRNGNAINVTLDGSNRVTQVTKAASGQSITFSYANGTYPQLATSAQDSTGTIATYVYGTADHLTQLQYPDGTVVNFTYDSNTLITNVTDGAGKVLESHTYDGNRRGLTSQRANGADKVTVSYPNGWQTVLTNSKGYQTTYNYTTPSTQHYIGSSSAMGCASCTIDGVQSAIFDHNNGNQLSHKDARNYVTQYAYDSMGNVISSTIPELDIHLSATGNYITRNYTYNTFAEVLTATDPLGNVTTNTYDAKGNLLTTTTPSPDGVHPGSKTTFTYDTGGKGLLTQIVDPLNNSTTIAYTAVGLIDNISDANGKVTKYTYDARGNRLSVAQDYTGLDLVTSFTYDARNRLTQIIYPDQTTTTYHYENTRGRLDKVTDQNGKITQYAYDDADRLISVTDAQTPTAGVTTYAYDTENLLTSITDALGRVTRFDYTSDGWLQDTYFPPPAGGATPTESYGYDQVGHLTSVYSRNAQNVSYAYDDVERLVYKQDPAGNTTYFYNDLASHLTQVSDPLSGTYNFTYDNMGRLKQASDSYNFLSGAYPVNYGYDAASNRTSMTDPQSGVTNYVYDTMNRLQTLQSPQGNFGFSYDALSRRTQMTRPNGLTTNYAYDNLSRLLSILHQVGNNTLDGATYTYENAGNRSSKLNQQSGVTENYSYDNIYQLLKVMQGASTTEQYSYDLVGNRLSSLDAASYSYNNANEMTSNTNASYTYDKNGNTLTRVDSTGTTSYTWDYQNHLTKVTLPGTGGSTTYEYDPWGRRVQKAVTVNSVTTTTNYVYDGANILEELDTSGHVLARYSQNLGIDEPLAELRSGTTSFYQADGLGSITSLSNSAATLVNAYTYKSFGKVSTSTGTTTNPLQYTARDLDSESGLNYYRARYYDSSSSRFVSEDPLRFDQGGNFYVYVSNTPTLFIDPTGLAKCCPSGDEKDIAKGADNARRRLSNLRMFGTAVLPTDSGANVGAMTGCLSGGVVKGTTIRVPNQYVMDIKVDPAKHPCDYECAREHERVHAHQCEVMGARFFSMSEAQTEIPAYMIELGCFLKMQYENDLGPYKQ